MGTCPDTIRRLIDRFDQQSDQVRSPDYNETQLRIDFVNPMFAELGWDLDNRQGFAEQYREVVHEDRLKVGGQTKAPDYSFRIGGVRKFFLEAKKPHVDIKNHWEPAYQLRRYGWSAKLAVSLLTDFEELAVYDCRIAPRQMEKPSVARREYITYRQYPERWDFIEGTFSKRAVLQGEFDRYCQTAKGRGAQEFDDAFLEEIEEWRKKLATNLALRNENLHEQALNFAVQRIIDRIIFLRICEDRGIEHVGQLQSLLGGEEIYSRLFRLFHNADARYNSGLFHFKAEKDRGESPDELTEGLEIDDAALKSILRRLYYPESPYEFTVVSADILGSVYERFLGKIITLTEAHRAKIEEKPEVRKAGGVYYTPIYIVQYIVQQTVGKLLEGKTPEKAAKLKILDPACGSGSFLLGAYQCLLDWHLKWYVADGPEKWCKGKSATLRPGPSGDWRLTIKERKRILLDTIHGVDIDFQAVEVTKLSLLLRVLEGETAESLGGLWALYRERALPDLGRNIQCGNSLIGSDITSTDGWKEMSEEERRRTNPFDYKRTFAEVFKQGGFDAVIGNPPYVRQEGLKEFKGYFQENFRSFASTADLFVYFIERGVSLLRDGGIYSIIVSSSLLRAAYAEPLREYLKSKYSIDALIDFGGLAVFADAKDTYVCVPVLSNRTPATSVTISKVTNLPQDNATKFEIARSYDIGEVHFSATAWSIGPPEQQALFERLMGLGVPLGRFVKQRFFSGVKTGFNEAFVVDSATAAKLVKDESAKSLVHRFVGGEDIRNYSIEPTDKWMIVIPAGWTRVSMKVDQIDADSAWRHLAQLVPRIGKHLKGFSHELMKREDQGDFWWELRPCDYYDYFEKPKIVFPDICKNPRFHLDESGLYLTNTAYCLGTADKRLLGFLNSRLFWFLIAHISIPFGMRAGKYRYRLIYQYMEHVPINLSNRKTAKETAIIALVDNMRNLNEHLAAAAHPHETERLQREIESTDRRIDGLVYELYGLTDTEIRIVEEATG